MDTLMKVRIIFVITVLRFQIRSHFSIFIICLNKTPSNLSKGGSHSLNLKTQERVQTKLELKKLLIISF